MTIKDVLAKYPYSNRKFAVAFGISIGTVESWSSGRYNPPQYTISLISDLIDRRAAEVSPHAFTEKQYAFCVSEIENYVDKMAYLSDIALSPIFGIGEEDSEIPEYIIDGISLIWEAYHRTINDINNILIKSGTTLKAEIECIPRSAKSKWLNGVHVPQKYFLLMLQEKIGLLPPITLKI